MADSASFELLDEYINDENVLVTYKWLSRTQGIHVNEAKRLLAEYVSKRANDDSSCINAIYLLAGMKGDDEHGQSHHVHIVLQTDLGKMKASMSRVTSCHVYSVQRTKLKDSNALYMADFDKVRETITCSNQYSGIRHATAEYRPQRDHRRKVQDNNNTHKNTTATPSLNGQNGKSSGTNSSSNKELFVNSTSKDETTHTTAPSKKVGKKTKQPQQKTMNFKTQATKTPATDNSSDGKGKKTPRSADSDEDSDMRNVKRRKVRQAVVSSSSEDEEMEVDDLPRSPVPSPVASAQRLPVLDSPEDKQEDTDATPRDLPASRGTNAAKKAQDAASETINQTTTKRRGRRRKLVPKTFMDDEGFMVTEKVWESDSTDLSDVDEKRTAVRAPVAPPAVTNKPKSASTTDKSKAKKAVVAAGKKQASLMNFFAKK